MADLNDLSHYWGSDLSTSSVGDVLPVSSIDRSNQRILRRLMTNPGDANSPGEYLFHPTYGAGLGRYVGSTADINAITSLIRGQVLLEDSVAQSPAPSITVTPITGGLAVLITYTEAVSGAAATLSFNVSQ